MENQSPSSRPGNEREWKLIEKLLGQAQDEHRKSRRWGIFFKILTFVYLFVLLFVMLPGKTGKSMTVTEEHVGFVNVSGVIAPDQDASADMIVSGLTRAFEAENAKAIVLKINSPGGSPVQSNQVYNAIKRLRAEYPEKKVYAAITDLGASGAYYIASAADEIYADPASIVGSIGVIMAGFGFQEDADKLGVERRLKADTHPEIFSGLFWTGEKALDLGLVDGLKSPGDVARDVVNLEEMVNYSVSRSPLEEFVRRFGVSIGEGVAKTLGLSAAPEIR